MLAPQRILIVRLGAMGDVIHALPAVATLRWALPHATIGWVIEDRWVELLATSAAVAGPRSAQKPLVNNIHAVNTKAWRSAPFSDQTWKEARAALRGVRAMQYDLALDFQGALKSGVISRLSGAKTRVGFHKTRERFATSFYTQEVAARKPHIIEQNFELITRVVTPIDLQRAAEQDADGNDRLQDQLFPVDARIEDWCETTLRDLGYTPRKFAILNPGAGWGAKCWPIEKYAEVARGLADLGVKSIVNFGPAEETLARQVEALSAGSARAVACSIGELISFSRRAGLFVGGDTGPMHLAAALRVPVVGIFGPTDPARNGPFATSSIVIRRSESVTNHSRRAAPDEAMLSITAAEVLEAARELLSEQVSKDNAIPPEAPDA
ncbi:MAG TPA: glycosyltransferase family 9 protein [Terriglobales bacterium]|nr:glycosyltransferase family 9 protein [Terriglobales bacterium]